MDTKRLILFVVFSFSILMLWDTWQGKHVPVTEVASQQDVRAPADKLNTAQDTQAIAGDSSFKLDSGSRIKVSTDLYQVEIDSLGGDIRRLLLNNHLANNSQEKFLLLDDVKKPNLYIARSGLFAKNSNVLPDHNSVYSFEKNNYQLADGSNALDVKLTFKNQDVEVNKIITFVRGSYEISVRYEILNHSKSIVDGLAYYEVLHDDLSSRSSSTQPSFSGISYFTKEANFTKINPSSIKEKNKKNENLSLTSNDGWIGFLQHYFISAWILPENISRHFYTERLDKNTFRAGVSSNFDSILPGQKKEISSKLYSGPQTKADLLKAAPGLDLSVDYGILTFICSPLFVVLSWIYKLVNNWGSAIILLTVLIKILFYPLSAASYKSMAQLRELAPRLQSMKEKFGDDKVKFQQAMLELYRTEKINPMGGCLPILIQIPVFISLYWVLMGAVELRHAPFFGWITDLSAPDTLFGMLPVFNMPIGLLPIIMGISMIVQTKLNPAPTDPLQAKLMMAMPVIFSVFFFFFPAGLVLYWVINNLLSILQQWMINRSIHAAALAKKGNAARK